MPLRLAFLFGFTMVVAHVPAWSQPSTEPKSALLLAAGALSWAWLAWKGRPMARYPWALLLPVGGLLLSALWSPAPSFGAQRMLWLLAALGIGTLLSEDEGFDGFMKGFLGGVALHAALIFLQWIPPVRALLPASLGADPFQGTGRGLFHNTNMAALPLVILAGWLLLSGRGRARAGHLVWVLPALALTQSRLGIGVCAAIVAYVALAWRREGESSREAWLAALPWLILAAAWSLTAHRWGWLLAAAGILLAAGRNPRPETARPPGRGASYLLTVGLVLGVLGGLATRAPKNAAQTVVQGALVQGDVSLSQRLSYYRAAALAFLDRPLAGQGLGSARPIYPRYVDRNRPAAEIAYGDFQRPNNLHSEPLEWLVEGGLAVVLLLMAGLWLDRKAPRSWGRAALLAPAGLIALLDFPFHTPLGLLWVGITLVPSERPAEGATGGSARLLHGAAALGLLILALFQVRVAMRKPEVERQFLARDHAPRALEGARSLWRIYPFAPDVFDLYSKSAIQMAATAADGPTVAELDRLLALDPFDHHLLLCRAQLARRLGDPGTARGLLDRYAAVAPRDPDRFLRLARTALEQGKVDSARLLILEAQAQPGFSPRHAAVIEGLNSQIPSSSGPGHPPSHGGTPR